MRTKTLLAAAAMLAAGLASSMAQSNVYSLNVVGYVNKVFVGGNKYTSVANPLNAATNTLTALLGGAGAGLPNGTRVLKWSGGAVDFTTYTKVAFASGWSGPGGTGDGNVATLRPGEGALVLSPVGSADLTNTFVGEVLQGNLTNSFVTGYQMAGNMVPDSGSVTTVGLTTNTPVTSRLLKWDTLAAGTTQGDWKTYTRTGFGTFWSGPEGTVPPDLAVAEGFLMLAQPSAFSWVRNFTVQ